MIKKNEWNPCDYSFTFTFVAKHHSQVKRCVTWKRGMIGINNNESTCSESPRYVMHLNWLMKQTNKKQNKTQWQKAYHAHLSERCCGSWWETRADAHLPWRHTRGQGTPDPRLWGLSGSCYYHWQLCQWMVNSHWCCLHWAAVAAAVLRLWLTSGKPCWIWNGSRCR